MPFELSRSCQEKFAFPIEQGTVPYTGYQYDPRHTCAPPLDHRCPHRASPSCGQRPKNVSHGRGVRYQLHLLDDRLPRSCVGVSAGRSNSDGPRFEIFCKEHCGHHSFGPGKAPNRVSALAHLTLSFARPPNLPHAATCNPVSFSRVRQMLPQPPWVPDHRLNS